MATEYLDCVQMIMVLLNLSDVLILCADDEIAFISLVLFKTLTHVNLIAEILCFCFSLYILVAVLLHILD